MRILGHGIDLIELVRVQTHLNNQHDDWVEAVFTADEQAQADSPPNKVSFFAGRYAAKEAVAKALGTGFSGEVAWQDIEILRCTSGAVDVKLSCGALDVANALNITGWFVSISHSGGVAIASAIAIGD